MAGCSAREAGSRGRTAGAPNNCKDALSAQPHLKRLLGFDKLVPNGKSNEFA